MSADRRPDLPANLRYAEIQTTMILTEVWETIVTAFTEIAKLVLKHRKHLRRRYHGTRQIRMRKGRRANRR